jgi:hypothetical protein
MKLNDRFALVALIMVVAIFCVTNSQAQTQPRNESSQTSTPTEVKQTDSGPKESTDPALPKSGSLDKTTEASVQPKKEPDPEPQAPDPDEWHFQFSPYLWIAGISGRAGIGDLEVEVNSSLSDDNVKLNAGFMGAFEARKNKFVLLADLQYSNLGTERPNPGILFSSAEADFKTFILDTEVGYRVAENAEKGRSLDIVGGVRWWHLETNLNFAAGLLPARSATASRGWLDAVGGLRGKMHLNQKIFMAGKFDLGGGGAKFTYQLLGVFGLHVHKNIALVGGYRVIHVDYDRDDFLFDMSLHGPILGATFVIK